MEDYNRSINFLRQAINTANQTTPQDKAVSEAVVSMKSALLKLEQASFKASLKKKQESQSLYQKTWENNIARSNHSATANQAVMRTWKDLNKKIQEEQRNIEELESAVRQNVSSNPEILKD